MAVLKVQKITLKRRLKLPGGRHRHSPVIGVDNMILAEILPGVPDDEQAKITGGNIARVYHFDVARLTAPA